MLWFCNVIGGFEEEGDFPSVMLRRWSKVPVKHRLAPGSESVRTRRVEAINGEISCDGRKYYEREGGFGCLYVWCES